MSVTLWVIGCCARRARRSSPAVGGVQLGGIALVCRAVDETGDLVSAAAQIAFPTLLWRGEDGGGGNAGPIVETTSGRHGHETEPESM